MVASLRRFLAAVVLVLGGCGTALASPESDAALKQGLAQLERGDFPAAEARFRQAIVLDPRDPRGPFFLGVALNRMQRHEEAFAALELARFGGLRNPRLDYETGWAAASTGRWQNAIEALERYETARPGDGKAAEFRARSHLGLGQLDRAEPLFREAMRRDPSLSDTAMLGIAEVQSQRGDTGAARATLERITRDLPGSRIGGTAREALAGLPEPQRSTRPWNAYAGIAFGRDSNVIAFSDEVFRPAGITRLDSPLMRLNLGGSYRFDLSPADTLTIGYNGEYTSYFDLHDRDTFDNGAYATYRHWFRDDVIASLTASGQRSYLDGGRYVTGWGIRPAVAVRPFDPLVLEAYTSFAGSRFPPPTVTPGVLDRDSNTTTIGGTAFLTIPDWGAKFELGGAHISNSAEGSDYDYHARRLHLGATIPLPWDVTADARATRTDYTYTNRNSLAPTTPPGPVAFGFDRVDDTTQITLRLSRPIMDRLVGYIQYDRTRAESNLPVFDYDRHVVSTGVVYRF